MYVRNVSAPNTPRHGHRDYNQQCANQVLANLPLHTTPHWGRPPPCGVAKRRRGAHCLARQVTPAWPQSLFLPHINTFARRRHLVMCSGERRQLATYTHTHRQTHARSSPLPFTLHHTRDARLLEHHKYRRQIYSARVETCVAVIGGGPRTTRGRPPPVPRHQNSRHHLHQRHPATRDHTSRPHHAPQQKQGTHIFITSSSARGI